MEFVVFPASGSPIFINLHSRHYFGPKLMPNSICENVHGKTESSIGGLTESDLWWAGKL